MSILSGVSSFFGLDIGTTAIRLVELRGGGAVRSLVKYAYVPVDSKLVLSDSQADVQKVGQIIRDLVSQANVGSKNVAVNLPSNKVFTTVIDFDKLPAAELGKAIKYQADSIIPTPLAESKLEWAAIGDSPKEPGKLEVLVSSVPNSFVEKRLDLLESIGLNVIAFEPDNLALPRALIAPGTTAPQLIIDIGHISTDIMIVMNDVPRLTRSIPVGMDALVRSAQQNLNVDEKQATQFVSKFGVSKEKLEGQVYQAIIGTVDGLISDIDKSIKFFQARYPGTAIDRMIVTGGASIVPELPLHLANKFGVNVEIGNAWRNVAFAANRQSELLAVSNQFGVAVGLAERKS